MSRWRDAARPALALAAMLAPVGCGDPAGAPTPHEEPAPASALAAVRARFRWGHDRSVVAASAALRFEVKGEGLVVDVASGSQPPPIVELASAANGWFQLEHRGVTVRFRLVEASDSPVELIAGVAFYRAAGPGGGDMLVVPRSDGLEDHVVLERKPPREELRYELATDAAGLRLVDGVLELLDEVGAPRLRMTSPILASAFAGRPVHPVWAEVELDGCAADRSTLPPWGRPLVPPCARAAGRLCHCTLVARWRGGTYPAIFDPAWTVTTAMGTARWDAAGAVVRDAGGRELLLVTGGTEALVSTTTASAELFDAESESWAMTAPMPGGARDYHRALALDDGRVLVTGGSGAAGNSAELYHPAAGWTVAAPMSFPRYRHAMVELAGGDVLVTGNASGLVEAEIYHPALDSWTSAGTLLEGRWEHSATRLEDGRVLVAGGGSAGGDLTSSELYDPETTSWSAGPPMSRARRAHGAIRLEEGSVLVSGGRPYTGDPTTELFMPSAMAWLPGPRMNQPRSGHACLMHPAGLPLVIAGGGDGSTAELLDPLTGWISAGSLIEHRNYGVLAAALRDAVVVTGAGSAVTELLRWLPLGAPCEASFECASAQCTEGVCCDAACRQDCLACRWSETGLDDGLCAARLVDPCAPYVCAPDGACRMSCESDEHCAAGRCRADGSCDEPLACAGDAVLTPEGATTPCAPYGCRGGACLASCTSSADCAAGRRCNGAGRCTTAVARAAEGGSCGVAPPNGPLLPAWFAVAALGWLRRRRRVAAAAVALLAAAVTTFGALPLQAQEPVDAVQGQAVADEPAPATGVDPTAAGAEPRADEASSALGEAKRLFAEAVALDKAGDYQGALALYLRSRLRFPSLRNTLNAAVCLDRLGRYDEALDLFEQLLMRHGGELDDSRRGDLAPRMADLRRRVGGVDVTANVAGALVIDGRARATLPLLSPLPVLPGTHTVVVSADGFESYDTQVQVRIGQTVMVDARLERLRSAGRLRVEAPALAGAELFVDGAPVGELPWEGTLAPGPHWYAVRRGDEGSAPVGVVVLQGATVRVNATAAELGPPLRVLADPPEARLWIGGVEVGAGRWEGRLPIGSHKLEAAAEGYHRARKRITVTPRPLPDTTLELVVDESHARWAVDEPGHVWLDLLGGVVLAPSFGTGAEASCETATCPTSSIGVGAVIALRAGYEFPFRGSVVVAGGYLTAHKRLVRQVDEAFSAAGAAGSGAVQTRYTLEDELTFGGPFAAAGIAYRHPLAGAWAVHGQVLAGVLFASAADRISASAAAGGRQLPVIVDGSGATITGADLLVLPEVAVSWQTGPFVLHVGLTAAYLALDGPATSSGEAVVTGGYCDPSAPATVDCAPGETFAQGEAAYGPALWWLPSAGARYVF